jgi:flagellar hook-associated protein 3 FlgL
MSNGISLLGQSNAQTNRLLDMNKSLIDLQRQMATSKKNETLAGFGFESSRVLRHRMDINSLTQYNSNIDVASTRIELMTNSMEQAYKLGEQVMNAIGGELLGGTVDMEAINTIAKNSLDFLQTLVNTEIDGRYLFSGSATNVPTLSSRSAVGTLSQSEVTNWLNGTTSTAQMMSNLRGYTDAEIGFDPALSTAGPVSIRVDQDVEVDYAVVGSNNGFDKLMKAFALAANLKIPDAATDVPDTEALGGALIELQNLIREGTQELTNASKSLSSKYAMVEQIKDRQSEDLALAHKLTDTAENADTAEVLVKLQYLQNQLAASYQVTNIVGQLSLVNYI